MNHTRQKHSLPVLHESLQTTGSLQLREILYTQTTVKTRPVPLLAAFSRLECKQWMDGVRVFGWYGESGGDYYEEEVKVAWSC